MHFDAPFRVVLHKGGTIEETLATENEREVLIRASEHVHSAHTAPFR